MKKKFIPISKPFFNRAELDAVQLPIKSRWVSQGKYVQELETKFALFTKTKYAAAVSSGTAALHTAMRAMGVTKGTEVILPAFTWISTANAIEECGGKPVFCDVSLDTFNINCDLIEERITAKTKGLLPVHLFGLCANMNKINHIAKENKLWVVEDAACAFNSFYKGRHSGTFGDIGCFSFHPRKSITTGEGGMIVTKNKNIYNFVKSLRNIGCSFKPAEYPFLLPEFDKLGYNYRMTDIQASLGISQMEKAEQIKNYKLKLAAYYDELMNNFDFIKLPRAGKEYFHSYQSYVVLYNPDNLTPEELIKNNRWKKFNKARNEIMNLLFNSGIQTRPGTHSVAHTELYSKKYNIRYKDFPCSFLADKLTIALPFYYGMTKKEQEYVANKFIYYYKNFY